MWIKNRIAMKTRQLLALAGAFLFTIAGLTSCNKDDGTKKETDQVFGKLVISDENSPIQSIELTKDFEYIVTKKPAQTKSDSELDLNDVWVYGNFTIVDGWYFLQGFGKIAIDLLSGGAAEVSIDTGDWDDKVHASLASTVNKTEIDRSLCRHWVIDQTDFLLSYNEIPLLHLNSAGCDFSKWHKAILQWFKFTGNKNEEQQMDRECTGLIFTESGTYAVLFDNGKVNVGSWNWENSKDGSLKCDWSNQYKSFFKDYRFQGSLVVDVKEGDPATCTIVRSFEGEMDQYKLFSGYSSHGMKTSLTYTLKEYK